jgi:hypothetical protein
MDSGESLRAPRSPATLTGGRSANESLESLGALLGYRDVGEPCRSNLCHSGPWSLAPPCFLSAVPGPLVRNSFQSSTIRRTDVKRQYHCETRSIAPEQIETLVVSLGDRVRLLDYDIGAE